MELDEDELDRLADLQHDLGKYLRMPLGFLPRDASNDQVRAAMRKALLETRPARSARSLWEAYLHACDDRVRGCAGFEVLQAAVDDALAWEERLDDDAIDRAAVERDFAAVQDAIRRLQADMTKGML